MPKKEDLSQQSKLGQSAPAQIGKKLTRHKCNFGRLILKYRQL